MQIEIPDDLPEATLNQIKRLISEAKADCGCIDCDSKRRAKLAKETGEWEFNSRFFACSICGNKRCPHTAWHGYKCTGSNNSNQIAEEL